MLHGAQRAVVPFLQTLRSNVVLVIGSIGAFWLNSGIADASTVHV